MRMLKMTVTHTATILIAAACVLPGCKQPRQDAPEPVHATVPASIVESSHSAWREGAEWRIDTVPALEIGVQDGPPEYQFFRLRDAVRLADGTLVAANAGSAELRFFDPSGVFIRASGRKGAGPGEFAEFSGLRICQDPSGQLLIDDGGNDRVNVISSAGQYRSTFRLPPAGGGRPASVIGCLGDGRLIAISWRGGGALRGKPSDLITGMMSFVVIDRKGSLLSTIADVPTRTRFVNDAGGRIHYPFIPFMPQAVVAGGHNEIYLTADGTRAVEKRAPDGSLIAVYRWPGAERTAVKAIWSQYVDWSLQEFEDANDRRRYARFYAQKLPLPDSVPAISNLKIDLEGNLWVERYRLPWESESVWDVLNATGQWLGPVAIPTGSEVFEIGAGHLLAWQADQLGVERLLMYKVMKP